MTRSYEDFYRFANFGDENWKPSHSINVLGLTGEIKAEGRKNFDTADTYGWEKVSARRVASAHPETMPFFTPTLKMHEAREMVGDIIHSDALNDLSGIGELRKSFSPNVVHFTSEHIIPPANRDDYPEKDGYTHDYGGVVPNTGPLAGHVLLNTRERDDFNIIPATVSHEVSHIVSNMGRQFVPAEGSRLKTTREVGHGWAFNATHRLILRNVLGQKEYGSYIGSDNPFMASGAGGTPIGNRTVPTGSRSLSDIFGN